jgi:hypothetical protein
VYVDLGAEAVVRADEVVAVLDVRALRASPLNGPLLDRLPELRAGPADARRGCRAVVVTRTGVLASPLSVETIGRRLGALEVAAKSPRRARVDGGFPVVIG